MPKSDYTSGNPYVKAFNDALGTFKDFSTFLADPGERQNIRQGAMDAINRGAVAGALGAPVDMANTALNLGKAAVGYLGNKAGVLSADQMPQLIDNPVGGSEYIGNQMRRFGMVSPNRNALAEGIAGFLPVSPSASGKAVAALAGGGMVPGMDLAATVFHGSPHKFDRFDSSKIGTGEGAQAYGHGLYLAESPGVAMTYQPRDPKLEQKIMQRYSAAERVQQYPAMQVYEDFLLHKTPQEVADNIAQAGYSAADMRLAESALKLATKEYHSQRAGSLYKVDLPDEAIAKMLDWDKPLSQQAGIVQDAIGSASDSAIGPTLYNTLAGRGAIQRQYGGGKGSVEAYLRSKGIPGIRYLDAGSRGQGQGTSNYVVFPGNENMLRILERNGQVLK
jgi:hypothetical protein